MPLYRISVAAAAVALTGTNVALAQSKRGTWAGTSTTQQGTQPFTIVLDSAATGWKGAAAAQTTTGGAAPPGAAGGEGRGRGTADDWRFVAPGGRERARRHTGVRHSLQRRDLLRERHGR